MSAENPKDTDTKEGLATVAGGAGLLLGGRIAKVVLVFATQVIMARLLGATAYGGVVLAMITVGVGTLIGRVGIDAGVLRNFPYFQDETPRARGVVKAAVQISLLTGGVLGLGAFLAAPIIATRVFDDPSVTPLLRIAALGIPFSVLADVGIAIARSARDAKTQVIVRQILSPLTRMLAVSALVFAGFGAIGAVSGSIFALVITGGAALFLAYRTLSFPLRGPTSPMRRRLLAFSLPLLFAASMDFVIVQADTFLIGVFRPSSAVGVYNVVFQLRNVGMFFFYPITFLLPPVLTRLTKQGEWQEARRTYQIATKWLVFLTTPIFLLVFLFPAIVIGFTFGAEYLPGATALRILMIPIMITVLLSANGAALIALGHNRINLYVNAGAAVLNIVLNLLLIPRFGIVGAAIASMSAFVLRDLLYTVVLYRWEGIQPFTSTMLRPYLGILVLSGAGYFLFTKLVSVTFLSVVAIGLVFLALYFPTLVVFGAVEPDDEYLLSLLEERTGVEFTTVRSAVSRLQI